eukprot:scaffold7530_cov74-Phaeocystis_antarctica.AAC.3
MQPRVLLHGLKGRPELNGREGAVVSHDTTAQRFGVQLEGEEKPLALKPDNLQPLTLPIGARVRLTGLAARPELNGQDGIIESTVEAKERVVVLTDRGEQVSVRTERLRLLPPLAASAEASSDTARVHRASCVMHSDAPNGASPR